MLRRWLVLALGSAALVLASSAAAAQGPTVAQIKAAIAMHSDDFVLANVFANSGRAPGHGWIDVKTGAGRWVSSVNGRRAWLKTVAPDPHHPMLVVVTNTTIDYSTRTWYRTRSVEPVKLVHPQIVDPLDEASARSFTLLGVETVDGVPTYHLRSTTYSFPGPGGSAARLDVWFSTDEDYLIRYTRTTQTGKVISRVDNHWLPRTAANLSLLTQRIPFGFRRVFVSS